MKLHIVSDLRLEFGDCLVPPGGADVLILAGDIHVGDNATEWLKIAMKRYEHVIYVLGNHEFYHRNMMKVRKWWQDTMEYHPNLWVLDNTRTVIDGVQFLGTTLWTDTEKWGLNDFHIIQYTDKKAFTPWHATMEHKFATEFLAEKLAEPGWEKTVVVTHHAPIPECVHPKWRGHELNGLFHGNLNWLINEYQPVLWVHGHMHDDHDFKYNKTRIVCNPRGYKGYGTNPTFVNPKEVVI